MTRCRDDFFRRIADVISPNGYLFVGSSENLSTLGEQFKPQQHCRSFYDQPNGQRTVGTM